MAGPDKEAPRTAGPEGRPAGSPAVEDVWAVPEADPWAVPEAPPKADPPRPAGETPQVATGEPSPKGGPAQDRITPADTPLATTPVGPAPPADRMTAGPSLDRAQGTVIAGPPPPTGDEEPPAIPPAAGGGDRTVLAAEAVAAPRAGSPTEPPADTTRVATHAPAPQGSAEAPARLASTAGTRTGSLVPETSGFEATRLALPPHVASIEAPDWPAPAPTWPEDTPPGTPPLRPRPRPRLQLPVRTRRYGFSLIAFADAMFQLLIFFMLASNLSTFSLLTISRGVGPGAAPGGSAQAATPPGGAPGQTAIWTLSREGVTAGGQRFDMAQVARLAEGARAAGTAQVLLVTRSGAEVQGVVRVLEALARNGITTVQLAAPQMPAGAPP